MRKISFTEAMALVSFVLYISLWFIESQTAKMFVLASIVFYWIGYFAGRNYSSKVNVKKLEER